ncbi:hypothetical protein OAP18_01730 [Gammaproteobacteria bacterium]|nr:hypothetical protein [Gammaproteobacteria bacterium]
MDEYLQHLSNNKLREAVFLFPQFSEFLIESLNKAMVLVVNVQLFIAKAFKSCWES